MLSIIVPVYNAGAYVDSCIQSVLNQSYRDLELILVNDGSTDDSLEKCRRWESDQRVLLLSTRNRGVSAARNLGMETARGRWILFLDSDDYLFDGSLERLMALITGDTQEVIAQYSSTEAAAEGSHHQQVSAGFVRRMTLDPINNQLMPDFYEVKPLSLPSCWAKLFRTDIIRDNAIRFQEELRLSEDTLFHLDYLACINQVTVTDLCVLYYRCSAGSVTKVFHPNQLSNRFRYFSILLARGEPDAPVHILSMLLYEICKIQRCTEGAGKAALEQMVIDYLNRNSALLLHTGGLALSTGRWQRYAYQAAVCCFRYRAYRAGFACLKAYTAITKGELNIMTGNEE